MKDPRSDRSRPITERFPSDWKDYAWDRWIPANVRARVTARWGPTSGQSPRTYHANAEDLDMPDNGVVLELPKFPVVGQGERVRGRYVHLAGRGGFIVDSAGRAYEVRVPLDWRGPAAAGDPADALKGA